MCDRTGNIPVNSSSMWLEPRVGAGKCRSEAERQRGLKTIAPVEGSEAQQCGDPG